MNTIAAGASLVAERQGGAGSRESGAQLANGRRIFANLARYSTVPPRPLSATATEI
ncbi:hypothetical protein ILT44_29060 [Microvirga sp. BT689]|uniref:hypothetical protein n=1 Tax=Microvirga arvi TaxID=2778731 RepID=UPI00195224F4|nr:hypothetical protein [Microvirga arvi]MBM6584250.1 hypothetical protein [Microvirga arvi]